MSRASNECLDCMQNCKQRGIADCINNVCKDACGIPSDIHDPQATWTANYIPRYDVYRPGHAGPNSGAIIAPLNTIEAFGFSMDKNKLITKLNLIIAIVILLVLLYHLYARQGE